MASGTADLLATVGGTPATLRPGTDTAEACTILITPATCTYRNELGGLLTTTTARAILPTSALTTPPAINDQLSALDRLWKITSLISPPADAAHHLTLQSLT